MYDIEIHMANEPGQLALIGDTLGAAGISVEGGGMFLVDGIGVAHFLVHTGAAATDALNAAGMTVVSCREVIAQRLDQDTPGQLGLFCAAMADAGVNIEVLYSDHDHQLVVVVDDHEQGRHGLQDLDRRANQPVTEPSTRRYLATADWTSTAAFDSTDRALTVTVAMIWGSSFLWIAIGLDSIAPSVVASARLLLGAGALWLYPPARRHVPRRYERRGSSQRFGQRP